jgi:hypothetical protein
MPSNQHTVIASFVKFDKFKKPLFIVKAENKESFQFLSRVMQKVDTRYPQSYNPINISSKDPSIMFLKTQSSSDIFRIGDSYKLTIQPIIKTVRSGKAVQIRILEVEAHDDFELLNLSDIED